MHKVISWILLFSFPMLYSCTTNQSDYRQDNIIAGEASVAKVTFAESLGESPQKGKAYPWRRCVPEKSQNKFVLLLYPAGALSKTSCNDPHVQAILAKGLVTVELEDALRDENELLGADLERDATINVLASFSGDFVGLWAHGLSTILGGRITKSLSLRWVIFSEGLYDMEMAIRSKSYPSLEQGFAKVDEDRLDEELEKRSLAWDYSGLPSLVHIYCADTSSPSLKKQARDFSQTLAASQVNVRNMIFNSHGTGLDSQGHALMIHDALKHFLSFTESSSHAAP